MITATINPTTLAVENVGTLSCPRGPVQNGAARKLALVIPTLREAENIGPLLKRIRTALDPMEIPYEIVVVDDDSRDGTAEIVTAMGREDARIRLLVRQGPKGLSGAVLHGWLNTDAPILGVMDADLQHPPELLPALVSSIYGGHDLAIGSRYTEGGGLGEWNPIRKLISAAAVWATWPIQRRGIRAKDPMSGFFFVRRACLGRIAFQQSGFKLLLEILVRARLGSIEEIPFAFGIRYRGASKASFKVAREYARLLARLYRIRFGLHRSAEAA
jgi:dolichol-phosphate mannosyltransferase